MNVQAGFVSETYMKHMYVQSPSAHVKARETCDIVRTGYSRKSK